MDQVHVHSTLVYRAPKCGTSTPSALQLCPCGADRQPKPPRRPAIPPPRRLATPSPCRAAAPQLHTPTISPPHRPAAQLEVTIPAGTRSLSHLVSSMSPGAASPNNPKRLGSVESPFSKGLFVKQMLKKVKVSTTPRCAHAVATAATTTTTTITTTVLALPLHASTACSRTTPPSVARARTPTLTSARMTGWYRSTRFWRR